MLPRFIVDNWPTIAEFFGVWAFLAGLVNKSIWPKPAPDAAKWKILLHAILIDGPGWLPSINMRGIFGLPVNVPFLSFSKPAPEKEQG